ncbi:FAD-dependent monooxygenase [Burkholderia guangdongensis]|uniref:FAD-dependent monooxygenase n=1 Tax=Burkholderia guangdongensis TaxID=1792500 RepID=UPI0015CEB849|nr:FAD-dependent monooxygenase [Burkholderia guangdongensis]
MAEFTTDVLIVGTGPAGSAAAALLSTYGIDNMVVNYYRWLANTPRAHITNLRTMEVLRDLGKEVEQEAYLHATDQDLIGGTVFCESLTGEEIGRVPSWGAHPLSRAERQLSSPTKMNDLPQTFMEPLLFKTACSRGTEARMSTEYLDHTETEDGVITRCRDRLSGEEFVVKSKYLIGADGGNSKVARNAGLPFEGQMGVRGSMNIWFRADLSEFVAHRPAVLYPIMQPGAEVGGIGMGLIRMVRPWNEWLIVWGYDINEPTPVVDQARATEVARQLVGKPDLEIELLGTSTWTVNNMYATRMQNGRVFCMGDATHRHPPSGGLGSNTSIQDAFNLAWKLAAVIKGQAGDALLDTYTAERAPVAKQIVTRANQSIADFARLYSALGIDESNEPEVMQANMHARSQSTKAAELQRDAIREALAYKRYELDAHGVEMNQRYRSSAAVTDGQEEPAFPRDRELYYQPTTWAGARLPHAWIFDARGRQLSTLDLAGHGRFTLFTGLGGEAWVEAAKQVGEALGLKIDVHVIGPRQGYSDHTGDWARIREVSDSGAVLVRPDHHVAWRSASLPGNPQEELRRVMRAVLAR